jgi:hypothetical protein
MPYYPPPVTGGGGQMTAAQIRSVLTNENPVYPTPPILQDWKKTGVTPADFNRNAVPKAPGDWLAGDTDVMSNAIEAAFATPERVIIGAPEAEIRVSRSIRPSGDNADDRFFRAYELWGDIYADGNFTSYHTVLGLDRSDGITKSITFSGNFVVSAAHGLRVGDMVTFPTGQANVLPTPLLKTPPGDTVGPDPDDANEYFIHATGFTTGQFRLSNTRNGAALTLGSATGTHPLAWGSLVGRNQSTELIPPPTTEPRGVLDLGNTRYSRMTGNFKLIGVGHGVNKPFLYGLCTTGHLNRTTAGGGGGGVFATRMQFAQLGCGIYVTPQYESANDYLADTITGVPIDTVYFDQNVDIPFVFAGNSADGAVFGSMNIALAPGATAYVSGSHVKMNRLFVTGRHFDDIAIRIKNGGVIIDEMYVEGQGTVPCLSAAFEMHNNSTLDIRHYKQGGANASRMRDGIVYDVSNNSSVQIRCQEKTARPSQTPPAGWEYNIPAFATLRTIAGARRFYDVYMPGVENLAADPGFKPFIFEAAGGVTSTNDKLIAHTQTDATSLWTWGASQRRKQVPTYGAVVNVP